MPGNGRSNFHEPQRHERLTTAPLRGQPAVPSTFGSEEQEQHEENEETTENAKVAALTPCKRSMRARFTLTEGSGTSASWSLLEHSAASLECQVSPTGLSKDRGGSRRSPRHLLPSCIWRLRHQVTTG